MIKDERANAIDELHMYSTAYMNVFCMCVACLCLLRVCVCAALLQLGCAALQLGTAFALEGLGILWFCVQFLVPVRSVHYRLRTQCTLIEVHWSDSDRNFRNTFRELGINNCQAMRADVLNGVI